MVAQSIIETVFALPVPDQMDLLERLRQRLLNDPTLTPISDEHRRLLDSRLDEFDRDPMAGSAWEEVEARVMAKLGRP